MVVGNTLQPSKREVDKVFRPILFKQKSNYELVLMKNRREELTDVPIEYVDSIEFQMGEHIQEPTKINLTIPSHIDRNGEKIEVHLFNMIKGKMQLLLTIDNKKFVFSIEEETVVENKDISTKSLVAYERFYKFNNTDFYIATDVATRQLYRKPNETVEVADGVLNWFEQQCTGWTVAEITEKARKELQMCSTTRNITMDAIDKTIVDEIISQSVTIDIGDKPLNMTINMECSVYDTNKRLYMTTTTPFKFNNLPYAISKIKADYVSTSKNFYGINFTITHTNGHTSTHEFPFINCKGLRLVAKPTLTYELGDLTENWVTKYRTFETTATTWMTMLNSICEAFDCIMLFDSYHQTVSVCHRDEFGELTNVALTYDNALQEISKERKLDELVTRLTVESANTTIASVNVLGTDYVECFDYFRDNGIMSEELQHALDEYDKLLVEKDTEFSRLLLQKHEKDQELILANSQLTSLENKYTAEKSILTAFIKSEESEKQKAQQVIVADLEAQIKTKEELIKTLKDQCANTDTRLVNIGIEIKKENAVYNGVKLFTDELLLELSDYIIEKSITDDVHLTALSVYTYVIEEIKKYQKPIIDFTITSSVEFIKRTGQALSDCIFLGAKMEIEDRSGDITSDDGTVSLYGFTINPNTDDVSSLSFTNNAKAPESPLKAISKTTQTAKATKSLTDFYKATWMDIKDKTVDIGKVINEGLDLAAQKVRSRSEKNIIDMSEAGIFLVDANNNDEQLALINDLISMTTDGWQTSKIAISPEGVIADTLIGRMILGRELFISNDNVSLAIRDNGMTIRDRKETDRIFLGLDADQNPEFRLGAKEDKSHLVWDKDGLDIKADKIMLGSENIVTESKLEQTADAIRMEVANVADGLRSEIKVTADEIRLEVANEVEGLNSTISQTAKEIRLEVSNAIDGVNTTIQQNAESIRLAVESIEGMKTEIKLNKDSIASKVDADGVVSVVKQNPDCVQFGFNGISDCVTIDATGIIIRHGNSYSKLDGNGFNRWDGSNKRSYHYLQYMGQVDMDSEETVEVTLPSEFKGKDFTVVVGIKRVQMAYEVYQEKFLLMGFYAELVSVDKARGTFKAYGSIRGVDSKDISGSALIAGADYAQDKLRPIMAYWVYA